MNIVVCVKQVPDTWSEKKLAASDSTLDRAATDPVMNEMDEYAVEEALKLQEAHGGEVTILCMGPDAATETVRKALSMGADKAIHVIDDGLHGSDALATSLALAKAIDKAGAGRFDLVLLGSESSDARMSVVPAMLAERLGLPQLTFAKEVTINAVDGATQISIKRLTDDGYQVVEASTPAVVSVVEKINEPRYPSFKGIMAAKKKPVETYGARRPRGRRRRGRPRRARGARSSRSRPLRPGRRAPSSRTRATERTSSWSSSRPRSSSEKG